MKLQWWIRQYLIKIRLSESLWFLVSDILALFVEWKCVLWNTSLPASSIGKPRCYYWTPPRWPDWQTQNGKPDFIVSSYDLLFRDVRVKPSWLPLDQSINFKDIYIVVTFKWHCQVTEFCPWLLYCFYHLLQVCSLFLWMCHAWRTAAICLQLWHSKLWSFNIKIIKNLKIIKIKNVLHINATHTHNHKSKSAGNRPKCVCLLWYPKRRFSDWLKMNKNQEMIWSSDVVYVSIQL